MARRTSTGPTYRDLVDHLEREEPLPIYAVIGEEPFARSQCVAALRRCILGDAAPEMALSQYEGSEVADCSQLLDELRTPAFLAPRRLVVVEDAAPLVSKAADALISYLKKPSKAGVLVLVLDKLPGNTRLGKAARKAGMVVACDAPRERELPDWIAARARQYDKRIDSRAARRLAECVGVNLPLLDQNLAKLALYVGDKSTINEPDVDALVEDLPVTTIFRLTDAVGSKSPAKALRVLDTLLAQNHEPAYIISMVRWAMERLINARTLLDAGAAPDAIAKALRMSPGYFLNQLLDQARRRTRPELLEGFALLAQTDLDTKTSIKSPRDALEHLLLRLCA